ncbi:hypothetical protein B0H17DRAFT_1212888 [Mycena rosella]|uniref:Uncharacterized protein n=1 Tax=Mycena rosella TaxID=1033263 RepID=A0AAD7CRG5_MYCRO|nr:hypothetical protein B0H17DRAFT_1212888 [Mycena rosella]
MRYHHTFALALVLLAAVGGTHAAPAPAAIAAAGTTNTPIGYFALRASKGRDAWHGRRNLEGGGEEDEIEAAEEGLLGWQVQAQAFGGAGAGPELDSYAALGGAREALMGGKA